MKHRVWSSGESVTAADFGSPPPPEGPARQMLTSRIANAFAVQARELRDDHQELLAQPGRDAQF
jgi:hypothetical protein